MPIHQAIPSRRSRRISVPELHDGSDEDLELLYPDSDSETQSTSSIPPVHAAPSASRTAHSRRRSEDHIPRPPNPFICFRSEYCEKNKLRGAAEIRDHREVSRLAGVAWRALSLPEKKKYEDIAREKKSIHAQMYPGYSYTPGPRPGMKGQGKRRRVDDDGDYEEHVAKFKRRRSRVYSQQYKPEPVSSLLDNAPSSSFPSSPVEESFLEPVPRSSAPSPDPRLSHNTPELAPNSSASSSVSPLPEPAPYTPLSFVPEIASDDMDDFIPTADIPPLDLYSPSSYSDDLEIKIDRSQHQAYSQTDPVGSQFFKTGVPNQTRDMFIWYNSDGTFAHPQLAAASSSASSSKQVEPQCDAWTTNYEEASWANPFELSMSDIFHMDRMSES
ncbi:HMG box domain-containing protein [Favolaschia claudopus]|uniref:HMG box domain-containing protein n=1 Tax=Favolaschia claudopus TaxID=2862362 RepID=A0AAW0EGR7_9AGAR